MGLHFCISSLAAKQVFKEEKHHAEGAHLPFMDSHKRRCRRWLRKVCRAKSKAEKEAAMHVPLDKITPEDTLGEDGPDDILEGPPVDEEVDEVDEEKDDVEDPDEDPSDS